jgi:hypothetical protein
VGMQFSMRNGLIIITSSFFLTACSFSFIYNNLAWLSSWYLDDYVELTPQQQQLFDSAFTEFHSWHRQTQLSLYYQQLTLFKQQVNLGLSRDDINQHFSLIKNHWFSLREQAKSPLLTLTHSLSDIQRKQVIDEIEDNNKRRIDDYDQLSEQKWISKQCKNTQKQLKKWLGKLTSDQKLTVCNQTKTLKPTFSHWMAYRGRWHSGLETALLLAVDKQQYEMLFTELISSPDSLKTTQYKALSKNNNQVYVNIAHFMINNLTAKQLRKLNRELDDVIDELKSLEMAN